MSECGQDVNVELQDVIANPLPELPTIPPSTGVGEVIDIDDWPTTGLIGIKPSLQVPTLSGYVPKVGDLAYLIKQGSQWLALGALSTSSSQFLDGANGWSWEGFENDTFNPYGFVVESFTQSGFVQTPRVKSGAGHDYQTVPGNPPPHGTNWLSTRWQTFSNAATSASIVFLAPARAVTPGQSYRMEAWMRVFIQQGPFNFTQMIGSVGTVRAGYADPHFEFVDDGFTYLAPSAPWQDVQGRLGTILPGVTSVHPAVKFVVEQDTATPGLGITGLFALDLMTFKT